MYYHRPIDAELIEHSKTYPATRCIHHCDRWHEVSSFIVYWTCPVCRIKVKLRYMSGVLEVADLFDAVFAWMERTRDADALVARRRGQVAEWVERERAEGHVVQTRSEEPGTFRPSVEQVVVPKGLLQAIRGFPPVRDVEHCGALFEVSPFDEECSCPKCEAHLVLRPPSSPRIEDVFDAVFYWMEIAKDADELVSERRQYYREEDSSD